MGYRQRRRSGRASDAEVYFGEAGSEGALRKERQLCREAFEAIGLALATLDDATWLDIELVAVEPAPDASRLAVVVRSSGTMAADDLERKLEHIAGYLRSELASALQRKRVPGLTFRIAPPEEP